MKKKRKAKSEKRKITIVNLNQRESKLIMLLARFPEVVRQARELNEPHFVANYLNELVQQFNRFYDMDSVAKAEEPIRNFRLALVEAVAQVIKNGLGLLGIETIERM